MVRFLIKRIWNNKWLFLCLVVGALSTTAVVGAMPMYVGGIFQKVLTNDLTNRHLYEGKSPTEFSMQSHGNLKHDEELLKSLETTTQAFLDKAVNRYPMGIDEQVLVDRLNQLAILSQEGLSLDGDPMGYPTRMKGYEDKVVWVKGQAPRSLEAGGEKAQDKRVLEVAVSESGMKEMRLTYGVTYSLVKVLPFDQGVVKIADFKVVGIYTIEDKNALFWSGGRYEASSQNLIFEWDAFEDMTLPTLPVVLKDQEVTTFFDYRDLSIYDLEEIVRTFNKDVQALKAMGNQFYLDFPVMSMLEDYKARQESLKTTLWIVMVPLLIIMAFYAVLVSNLIVKQDRNEIAVLKSRGASRRQIFMLYLMESIIIGLLALVLGPHLSKILCRLLGASNGFLEFVRRAPMVTLITKEVYLYSLLAVFIYSICILIPVVSASRMHIVHYKQSLLGDHKKAFWHRFYLDLILMVVSLYGLWSFKTRQEIIQNTGASSEQVTIDPLLFFISTLFILGVAILFLRVYPWLVKGIFKVFENHWHPVAYFSLVNVAEGNRHLQAIMLFLILSISFGLMSANQARTINQNLMDRVAYEHGADIVIEPYNNLLHQGIPPKAPEEATIEVLVTQAVYKEPPYPSYQQLKGVDRMTKVFKLEDVKMNGSGDRFSGLTVMGIRTNQFGEIAWFRNDLLSHHINDYLNLLAGAPKAVLLSSNFRAAGVKVGDQVELQFAYMGSMTCTVYGFVDYFPSFNPFDENGRANYLAVVNDYYMDASLPLRPYEIWLDKEAGVTDTAIYDQLEEKGLEIESIRFMDQGLIGVKNDPLLLGMNGSLTMCFMVEMIISAFGFIIFWLLSMQERKLKFGIFRAIGMPMGGVNGIMIMEQVLVSGIAILVGFVVGSGASTLFVPLLEVLGGARDQVPPFMVVADQRDYVKVLGATGITLLLGLCLLFVQAQRTNVNQIIKLGEDS